MHGLDGLAKRHGLGPLGDGELADRFWVAGHPPARRTRINRHARRPEAHLIEELGDRARRPGGNSAYDRHAKTGVPRQRMFSLAQAFDDAWSARRAAWPGRPGAGNCPSRRSTPPASRSRQSASTRSLWAATATSRASGKSPDDSKPLMIAPSRPSLRSSARSVWKTPRGGQGQYLAAAMAEHRVGMQAQPGQDLVQGPLRVQDDVDRRRGRPELFVTAGHRAEQVLAGRHRLAQVAGDPVGRVEQAGELRENGSRGRRASRDTATLPRGRGKPGRRRRRSRAARPSNRRPGRREWTGKRGRPVGAATAVRRSASSGSEDATRPRRAPPGGCSRSAVERIRHVQQRVPRIGRRASSRARRT